MYRATSRQAYRAFVAISLVALLSASVFIILHPFEGVNYQLYRYFAESANNGVDVFRLEKTGVFLTPSALEISPTALDFSPASLFIYRVLFWIQDHLIAHFYFIYQVALGWAAIALSLMLASDWNIDTPRRLAILVAICLSPAWLILSALSGEDKLIMAAGPLLIMWLSRRSLWAFALATAVYAGTTGSGILFLPLIAVVWWQTSETRRPTWRDAALMAVVAGVVVALMCLYMPESAIMYRHRVFRESVPPFWYSIWRLAPNLFNPTANKLIIVGICGAIYAGCLRRTVTIPAAIVSIQFTFFIFANFINNYRVVAFIFLPLLVLRKPWQFWAYLAAVVLQLNIVLGMRLMKMSFVNAPDMPMSQLLPNIVLTNGCLVFYLIMVAMNAIEGEVGRGRQFFGDLPSPVTKRSFG